MNKLEKCYYVVIRNKKRGKFYGAGPIQVAKKVASKKLKAGKEMEFYLDEMSGKKKRYGPYQVRKDKKTGRVSVVKGRKVMKGGALTNDMKQHINRIFENNCQHTESIGKRMNNYIKTIYLPMDFSFGGEPLVFFNPILVNTGNITQQNKYEYQYAVFKEINGNIWILLRDPSLKSQLLFMNFVDFFLNPDNLQYFTNIDKNRILTRLKYSPIIPSRTICAEAEKIYDLLNNPIKDTKKQKAMIYVPNYYQPRIRKCVYPDLTFGVLDEQTGTITSEFPRPESNYQKFLILKQTGLSGMSVNEPVIYVRVPVIGKNGGLLTVEQIDNYLKEIDGLIQKIKIRNTLLNSRKFINSSTNNIILTSPPGIKKINDDISLLERYIIGYVLPNPLRIISKEDKELQIIRLNKLKIIILQQKLQLQQIQPQQQFRQNEQTQQLLQIKQREKQLLQIKQLETHLETQLLQIKQLETQLKNQQQKLQLQQIQPQQQFQLNEQTQQLETRLKNQQRQFRQNEQTQQLLQIKQLQTQLQHHFDYCIYTNPTNRKELMIQRSDGSQSSYFHKRFDNDNIKNICNILLGIPEIFGRLERVQRIAKDILLPKNQDYLSMPKIQTTLLKSNI